MFFISRRVMQGRQGKSLIITGVVLVLIGVGITVGTYAWAASRGGGHYYITFTPIIIGIIAIVRGISQTRRGGTDYLSSGQGQGIPQGGYGGYGGYGGQGYGGQGGAQAGGQGYGPQGDTGQGFGAQGGDGPREYSQPGYGMPRYDAQGRAAQGRAAQGQDYRTEGQDYRTQGQDYGTQGQDYRAAQAQNARAQAQGARGGASQSAGQYAGQPGAQPEPNWYPDPRDPSLLRWWDGQSWTPNTQPRR